MIKNKPSVTILDNGDSVLRDYYQDQLNESISLVQKDPKWRYGWVASELKRLNLLPQSFLCVGCRNTFEIEHFQNLGIERVQGIDLFSSSPQIWVMDMQQMTFKDGEFGAVYSGDSFEHALDVRKAASEFIGVCRDGGLICITVPMNYDTNRCDLHSWNDCEEFYGLFSPFIDEIIIEQVSRERGKIRGLKTIFRIRKGERA